MTEQDPTRDRPEPGLASTAPLAGGNPTGEPREKGDVTADEAPTPVIPEVAASLTDALRAMYDNVVDEPLPDTFAQLLSQLDDSDG